MDTKQSFAAWLDETIWKKRLSKSELARRAGLSRGAISNFTSGRITNPDNATIVALARGLGVSPQEVMRAANQLPYVEEETVQVLVERISALTDEQRENVLNYVEYLLSREGKQGTNHSSSPSLEREAAT